MEPLQLWQIAALAIVQGITEFLPISSSGHLVIVAAITGVRDEVADLNVVLHMGTLLSIFVFYSTHIVRLLRKERKLIPLLVVGTLPAVVVGVTIELFFEQYLEDPLLAGCLLPVTGLILLWAAASPRGESECADLTVKSSLLIGLSQALAILPGISRSGSTISTGLRLGLTPQSAATFSFLLAIPAIGGAGLLKLVSLVKDASESPAQTSALYLAIGAGMAFAVGLAALYWLIRWLERGRFQWFAWWCIPVGLLVVGWQLIERANP